MTGAAGVGPVSPERQAAERLLAIMLDAAEGRFPPVDGGVTLLGPLPRRQAAVVSFTGHAVIASEVATGRLRELGVDGFGAALRPDVLLEVAGPGGDVGTIDATLVARSTGAAASSPFRPALDLDDHPRVRLARSIRDYVRVFADDRGLVTLADGLAGRRELSIELWPQRQGRGLGPAVLRDALSLAPGGEWVFAAVAPGNARSLRAFLDVGFAVLGSQSVIVRGDA